jgi:hypothetical protein
MKGDLSFVRNNKVFSFSSFVIKKIKTTLELVKDLLSNINLIFAMSIYHY